MLVGTHPSALPEETLESSEMIDAVALREFDYIVRDVARALERGEDPFHVNGLAYRDSAGNFRRNPDYPFITELDDIPFASAFIRRRLNVTDYFFAAAAYISIQRYKSSQVADVQRIAHFVSIHKPCTGTSID